MENPTGQVVEFIDKNRVVLGLVLDLKKGRLGVLTSGNRQVALSRGRALLFTPAGLGPGASRAEMLAFLEASEKRRDELIAQVDVAELWDLVHAEEEPVSLADLAELTFGAPVEPDQQGAVLRALFYDRLHFRLAGNLFLPLGAEQLEAKRTQLQREEAYRREVDGAAALLRSLAAQNSPQELPADLARLLTNLLVLEEEAPEARKAREILRLAEVGGRKKLFNLLVRLGVLEPHENLPLLKEGLASDFASQVEEAAAKVDPARALDQGRHDLRGLHTFTIDGFYTTDFDDALSFEPDGAGGGELGVHITDAASLLPPDGLLEQEARGRGSSIYLPDERIPMLPRSLSEGALSLRAGQERPALSCLAAVDAHGRVSDFRLLRSVVLVDRRLTYDEADQLLESDARLGGLFALCQALRERRKESGAYFLPLPEMQVGVDAEYNIYVRRIDREGPSREMVAETAIVANWLQARYLAENQVPALYRVQPPPNEPFEQGAPDDLYLHFKQRRLLKPVEICTEPGRHASLGMEPYTHITSPIRRYLDLVMQRQLGATLAGQELPYHEAELRDLVLLVQPAVRTGFRVRQARQRYWLLCWLAQHKDQHLPAIVMEEQTRRWSLLLSEIMLLTSIPKQAGLALTPGQEVELKIERVDPFDDILRVKLA